MKSLLLVDFQSITLGTKKKFGSGRVRPDVLLSEVQDALDIKPTRLLAFGVKSSDDFPDLLKSVGFETDFVPVHHYKDYKTHEPKILYPSRAVSIACTVFELLPNFDQVILGTGDTQFLPLIDHIKRRTPCVICAPLVPRIMREQSSKWFEFSSEIVAHSQPNRIHESNASV